MALLNPLNSAELTAAVYRKTAFLWVLFSFASLSFFTTLGLPYIGEEAVYTITSLEMWHREDWIRPFLYGTNYGRPPLYNWLIIALTKILGLENILLSSRLIAAFATVATGFLVVWFVNRLLRNPYLAVFAALLYFSGDLLVWRGWHAYADPLFSLFIFSAVACTWIALNENRGSFLFLSFAALILSFLTKAMTGYVFYFQTVVALLIFHPNRKWLLKTPSILGHVAVLLFPIFWYWYISEGAHGGGMIWDITSKYTINNTEHYLHRLMIFPLETLLCTLPGAGLLLFFMLRSSADDRKNIVEYQKPFFTILCWIVILNFLPYWLAPQTRIRYLAPWYPFFAIFLAHSIFQLGNKKIKVTLFWLSLCIFLKYVLSVWAYPYYEDRYGERYAEIAEDILKKTQKKSQYPLYTENDSSSGLSITALINIERFPNAPLVRVPRDLKSGFLISGSDQNDIFPKSKKVAEYSIGDKKVYLLCKGKACEKNYGKKYGKKSSKKK